MVKPNHWLSTSRRFAGIFSLMAALLTGERTPASFARCRFPASTVTKTSAGVATPSALIRESRAFALPVIRFTSIPVCSVKRSSRGTISLSLRAEYTFTSAAMVCPARIAATRATKILELRINLSLYELSNKERLVQCKSKCNTFAFRFRGG